MDDFASQTDAALIKVSLRDATAFAGVFDRHWDRIFRFCTSRVGAPGEDLAAETFRVAFDQRRRFDGGQPDAAPWLYGIATNLVRGWFRSASRGRRALDRSDRPADFDPTDEALDRVEAEQLGFELATALETLTAAERDALLLHAWADLTYEQIATALDVPVGTVRSRIHRARQRMRAQISTAHAT